MVSGRPTRLAVLGDGRMGTQVVAAAQERGLEVVARLGRADVVGDRQRARQLLADVDVAVEFTTPDSVIANIDLCIAAGCSVVVGTTGWHDRLAEVTRRVHEGGGSLLWSANFSMGVAVMMALARRASTLLARLDDVDVHLVETHHTGKLDAPSGTALALRDAMRPGLGRDVAITSLRIGHVPGTHELIADGSSEQLTLRHRARDRRVFADGALRAAEWLRGRAGVFTMDDVLGLEDG